MIKTASKIKSSVTSSKLKKTEECKIFSSDFQNPNASRTPLRLFFLPPLHLVTPGSIRGHRLDHMRPTKKRSYHYTARTRSSLASASSSIRGGVRSEGQGGFLGQGCPAVGCPGGQEHHHGGKAHQAHANHVAQHGFPRQQLILSRC